MQEISRAGWRRKGAVAFSVIVALLISLVAPITAATATPVNATAMPNHVFINQKCGAMNTSDTISHSFIELYNPTNSSVNMTGWHIDYAGDTTGTVDLSGKSIPAHGYFFIKGKENYTPGPNMKLVFASDDSDCDLYVPTMELGNKNCGLTLYNAVGTASSALVDAYGEGSATTLTAGNWAIASTSKQSVSVRVAYGDTADDFQRYQFDKTAAPADDAVYQQYLSSGLTPGKAKVDAPASVTVFDPQDLIINVGSDQTKLNFNWYSDDTITGTPKVKVSGTVTPFAGTQAAAPAEAGKNTNKVTVSGLTPNTTYSFQVSSDGVNYSATTYTFKTGGSGDFTFAAVGDPQIGASGNAANDAAAWKNSVADIMSNHPAFIAGTGDQMNDSNQTAAGIATKQVEYAGFIAGLNQSDQLVPFAATMGNHEGDGTSASGPGRQMFECHYNITNAQNTVVDGFKLQDYYYSYDEVLYVVLDTAPYPADATAAQAYINAYRSTLAAATTACAGQYKWLVVQTHKSEQSLADHNNDADINAYSLAGFEDLMTQYGVDLVITGHDHSYTRTYPFTSNGGPLVTGGITIDEANKGNALVDPDGTVYLVLDSASGSKYYSPVANKATTAVESQTTVPEYTLVNVTADKLSVTTKEVGTGTAIDAFSIEKTPAPLADPVVAAVITMIDDLPTPVALADKADVEAARAAYDALTSPQQALVTNYNKLQAAEATIAALEKAGKATGSGAATTTAKATTTLGLPTTGDSASLVGGVVSLLVFLGMAASLVVRKKLSVR